MRDFVKLMLQEIISSIYLALIKYTKNILYY